MRGDRWDTLLLGGLVFAAASQVYAQGKMFKCVADGHTVYQQTACPVSQDSNEVRPAARAASAAAKSASKASAKVQTANPAASAASHAASKT